VHLDVMVRAPYLPRAGETLIGDEWWWKAGGKGANQAMAGARHGARVAMIGALGDDDFGSRLRERLVAAGVDTEGVRVVGTGSGMSVAIQQADGDYAAVVVSGANRAVDAAQVLASADAIRASAVVVLQNEIDEAANVAAARLGREAEAIVVLNAAPARPIASLEGLVDVLVVNAIEAEQLGAGRVDDLASAADAARGLARSAPTVVVTAGGQGLAAWTSESALAVPAHPVDQVETHGAGDVFVGALAARLADGASLAEALRYANAAAALHVSTPGPSREALGPAAVQRLLASVPS
jgi:ribokinase